MNNNEKYTLEFYQKREEEKRARNKGYYLKKRHPVNYRAMLESQNSLCAICFCLPTDNLLKVDSDPLTGKIRALLCLKCNRGLAYFSDNKDILFNALTYLNKYS